MALLHYLWSRVAANNATADSAVNMAEGMAPSAVNDGIRALMASAAGFRDDISGAIVTGGSSTAYTVSTFQVFDTLAHMDKMVVAFTPHATNGATVTLNVDSLGAKPLRSAPSVELFAGTLVQGTPYVAVYNNSDAVFYLQNFYGNPYNIPIGGSLQYWGSSAPNSSFVLPFGQAISRTTYAALFSLVSTTYGIGDGSTTFNIPDLRGRVSAGIDNMGGSAAGLFSGVSFASGNSTTAGSKLGIVTQTIGQSQLPNVAPAFAGASTGFSAASSGITVPLTSSLLGGVGGGTGPAVISTTVGAVTVTGSLTPLGSVASINGNVTQAALPTVQPTILCNYIMRII